MFDIKKLPFIRRKLKKKNRLHGTVNLTQQVQNNIRPSVKIKEAHQ